MNGHEIKLLSDRNPENLPWNEMDIDVVIEATGKFNHGDKAVAHINAGAKRCYSLDRLKVETFK